MVNAVDSTVLPVPFRNRLAASVSAPPPLQHPASSLSAPTPASGPGWAIQFRVMPLRDGQTGHLCYDLAGSAPERDAATVPGRLGSPGVDRFAWSRSRSWSREKVCRLQLRPGVAENHQPTENILAERLCIVPKTSKERKKRRVVLGR